MTDSADYIIGLGASAGGLDAIQGFFEQVPPGLPCAFVVLQHQGGAGSLLSDLLRHGCGLPIEDARDGAHAVPGVVTVVPPASDLSVAASGQLSLSPADPGHAWYPIDRLFESLAHGYGERALGIVLSGTGSDGALGARALKDQGGTVFVQEPGSAGFDGMPNATIATGLADLIARPRDLARHLAMLCQHEDPVSGTAPPDVPDYQRQQILAALRGASDTDFTFFSAAFVDARIGRRMRFHQLSTADDYLQLLTGSAAEQGHLARDLQLRMTRFLRRDETFERLSDHLRQRLRVQPLDQPYRVWVPGCSTGEEAVSIDRKSVV